MRYQDIGSTILLLLTGRLIDQLAQVFVKEACKGTSHQVELIPLIAIAPYFSEKIVLR
jgi:hypothetical protein